MVAHLKRHPIPLVMVAEPRLLGRLREEVKDAPVEVRDVNKDPGSMDAEGLRAAAMEVAGDVIDLERDDAVSAAEAFLGGDGRPGGTKLEELLQASEEGRLETLFVTQGHRLWGRYDENTRSVELHDDNQTDNEDLINLLATKALQMGGEVYQSHPSFGHEQPQVGLYRF